MQVVEYSMSVHFGICAEADEILGIYVGEKPAWEGLLAQEGSIPISRASLFGGIKKEGGVKGYAYFLPGGPLQTLPTDLAARFGLTRDTCPGFRGLASIFFVGGSVQEGWTPIPGGSGAPPPDPNDPSSPGGGGSNTWNPPGGGDNGIPIRDEK